MKKTSKPKYIVSIDWGTSRSGFSILNLLDEKSAPIVKTNWLGKDDFHGSGAEHTYSKDASVLLFRKQGCEFVSWGTKALLDYAKMPLDKQKLHFIADNFKPQIIDLDGIYKVQENGLKPLEVEVKVLDLVVIILKELSKEAVEMLQEKCSALPSEILFVVSLPALYGDNFEFLVSQYREAIKKAGIGEFLLVLEPKAATVSALKNGYLRDGVMMMIDAGGGTSDIMSSSVTGNTIEAIKNVQPTSEFSGSTFVDRMFWQRLCEISPLFLKFLKEQKMTDYIITLASWERVKCQFDPSSVLPNYKVKIGFKESIQKLSEKFPDLPEHLNEDGEICFSREQMLAFFEPTLNAIVLQVKAQQEQLKMQGLSCDQLVFVGGYALSEAFRQRMKQEFGNKMCNFPDKDGSAVVKGASWFGAESDIYRHPLAPYTYGFESFSTFDPSLDAPHRGEIQIKERKWLFWEETIKKSFISEISGKHLCRNRFSTKVIAGKPIDHAIEGSIFSPIRLNQDEMEINIYRSDKKDVRYTDDPSCKKIGLLTIKREPTCSAKEWQVKVSMRFYQDQIELTAIDLHSGKQCATKIEFTPVYKEFDT